MFYLLVELNVVIDDFALFAQLLNDLVGGGVGLLCHTGDVFYSLVVVVNVLVDLCELTVSGVSSVSEVVFHHNQLFYFLLLSINMLSVSNCISFRNIKEESN